MKLTVFSWTLRSCSRYSGRGCSSSGVKFVVPHLYVISCEYRFQNSRNMAAENSGLGYFLNRKSTNNDIGLPQSDVKAAKNTVALLSNR